MMKDLTPAFVTPAFAFDPARQTHARAALERILATEGLAKDVAEVVGNALNEI